MFKRTCEACESPFEAKSRNARFCSKTCRPTPAQREAARAKEWKAEKKAEKQREQEYLKKEMAFQQQARKAKGLPAWDERELRQLLLDNW